MASRASQQVMLTFIGSADHPPTTMQGTPTSPMDTFSFHRTRHPAAYRPQKHLSVADGFHQPNGKQFVRLQSGQTYREEGNANLQVEDSWKETGKLCGQGAARQALPESPCLPSSTLAPPASVSEKRKRHPAPTAK